MAVTLAEVKANRTIHEMIWASNKYLEAIGYTDHGPKHVGYVSRITGEILAQLGYPARTVELGEIAGWVHDVGNLINRKDHGLTGAAMLFPVLREIGLSDAEAAQICTAVGNHEEENGKPVSEIGAALIIADKVDAHRVRVRRNRFDAKDIHDRVNYSIKKTSVTVDRELKIIRFACEMEKTASIKDFLEIYLSRINLAEASARFLGCTFELWINNVYVNNTPPEGTISR